MARHLALGLTAVAVALWMTFFAGPGTVEVATLAAAVVSLVWFATVDPGRLVDERGRPLVMLFGLGLLAGGLLVTAAALLSTSTTLLTLGVGTAGFVIGLARSIRYGLTMATEE